MEKIEPGKYVEITYDLYEVNPDGTTTLVHQVDGENPERIVYGITPGVIVPLAEAISGLEPGAKFDVTVKPSEAFGEYDDNMLRTEELPRDIFMTDGKFDEEKVYPGAVIYLMTNVGQEVKATVVDVTPEHVKVTVDFNHPLAGKTVRIDGTIKTVREATPEEVAVNQGHCGCGSCHDGQCGDGCGCGDDHCGCGGK